MKLKKIAVILAVMLIMSFMAVSVYAAGTGDVAGAVQSTWDTAKIQIKTVVNNVVFPVLDLILAVFLFVKLGSAYFD